MISKMRFGIKRFTLQVIVSINVIIVCLMLYGCANIARPGGGPYDEEAPVFVKGKPSPNQLNVNTTKIELIFDENIKLDNPSTKVIVSPPQQNMALVKSNAKTVTVELNDTLIPNTTYTIDFTDAIQDNNEGNALKNFSYAFSTGDVIDSMMISGNLLDASNLEPLSGIIVGIHSNLEDSAFTTIPMDRIGRTDDRGRFNIYNIKPGTYKIYALKDINNNYIYDLPNEDIAFLDSIIIPSVDMKYHRDTIFKDSAHMIPVPHYYPDNIVLKMFNEEKKQVYLEKTERVSDKKFTLTFSAPQDTVVFIEPLNFSSDDWSVTETNLTNDTVSFWIKDSLVYKMDTIVIAATYQYTDTLNQLVLTTDTIEVFERGRKAAPKKEEKKPAKKKKGEEEHNPEEPEIEFITSKDNMTGSIDIGVRPKITFDEPIVSFDTSMVRVSKRVDTLFVEQKMELLPVEGTNNQFEIRTRLQPGERYQVEIDSAAVVNLYGLHNNKISKNFNVRKVEEYGALVFEVKNADEPAFLELLNGSDAPVYKADVINGIAKFPHVKPGTYYARIVLDKNNNGKFDTGNYEEKRQPDIVYYYSNKIELKPNWQVKQEWDVLAQPLINQKPLEITKNKPKEEKKRNYEQERNAKKR